MTLVGRNRPVPLVVPIHIRAYGALTGDGRTGNAMLWVLADRTAVVVRNNYTSADGVMRTVHPVNIVRVSPHGVTISTMDDGPDLVLTLAPCVCGAGNVARAMPVPTPEDGNRVTTEVASEMPEWITRA